MIFEFMLVSYGSEKFERNFMIFFVKLELKCAI